MQPYNFRIFLQRKILCTVLNIYTLYLMNENTKRHKLTQDKPININISFNINKKKSSHNTQKYYDQATISEKDQPRINQIEAQLKAKNQLYFQEKPLKSTRQAYPNTDLVVEVTQKNQRKKSKRGFSDFVLDRSQNSHNQQTKFVDLSNNHHRGFTTSFIKNEHSSVKDKMKSQQFQTKKSLNITPGISVVKKKKSFKQTNKKTLKKVIYKVVTSYWSNQSLQFLTEKRKRRSNFSAELTSKKYTQSKDKKRRHSRSEMLKKQEVKFTKKSTKNNIKQRECRFYGDEIILQKFQDQQNGLNSVLGTQIDLDFENEQQAKFKYKRLNPRERIYIKTDQSIDFLSQIQEFDHQKFKKDFFNTKDFKQDKEQMENDKECQTKQLIEKIFKIFEYNQPSRILLSPKNQNINKSPNHQESLEIKQNSDHKFIDRNQFQTQKSQKSQDSQCLWYEKSVDEDDFADDKQESTHQKVYQNEKAKRQTPFNIKKEEQEKINYLLNYLNSNINKKSNQQLLSSIYRMLNQTEIQKVQQQNNSQSFQQDQNIKSTQQMKKYLEFEQFHSKPNQNKVNTESYLEQQIIQLKSEFQRQQNDNQMIAMDLQTLQKALNIRMQKLKNQKQKELSKLQLILQEQKITQLHYFQQINKIQKWFQSQINQIHSTKKNIQTSYNKVKRIFQKGQSKNQPTDFKSFEYQNTENNEKTQKMIKCLSQSILKKKATFKFQNQLNQQEKTNTLKNQIPQSQGLTKNRQKNIKNVSKNKKLKITSKINDKPQHDKNQFLEDSINKKSTNNEVQMKKIDLFSQKINSQRKDSQKEFESDSSLQSYSFSQLKKQNSVIDSEENIEKRLSQKQTDSQIYNQQIKTPKKGKSKKIPTELNTQKQQFSVQTNEPKAQPIINNNLLKLFETLTQDDREDIFQFLFLDLCIQIYQDKCTQNKIMNRINQFITKNYEMSQRKKGIKTNLNVVKDYLKRFCGYVLRTNKKTLQNLNTPMGPTAIQMLKYMHESEQIENQQFQETENTVTIIVPISIFDTFERSLLPTIQFQNYYDDQQKEKQRIHFLKNVLHIHNKAIYDALNEYLDHQRPFGIWGKPFPWKKSSSFSHFFDQIEQQEKLRRSAEKVVESCSYVCGLMVDKQQSLISSTKVSQAYIQQIKEDRISRMLANDMIENQERWLFYDDQETEVLVDTGLYIFNRLLIDFVGQMTVLYKRKLLG